MLSGYQRGGINGDSGRRLGRWPAMGSFLFALAFFAALLAPHAPAQARYASIVVDFETGQVLHETNADTRNYPASLAKILTLYLAFEALEQGDLTLKQKVEVSRRAAGMPSSKLGLRAGDMISVEDLILALVTKSANDAAVVMAEAIGGKEYQFARRMTEKARELGMTKSSFRNSSGLPNRGQLSTARDMAKLARALIRDFPAYYELFATEEFTYRGQTHSNHNRLLRRYEGTDGIKTGYIRASGFNMVASAVRDGRRLIAVVFGGKTPRSRDGHIASLLDDAFAKAATIAVAKAPLPPRPKPLPATTVSAAATESPPSDPSEISEGVADQFAASATEAIGGGWGIQVGAFYQRSTAERAALAAADRVPGLLDAARVLVTDIRGQRGRIYRARLVGLDKTVARNACLRLKAIQVDCLVVQVAETTALGDLSPRLAAN